MADIDVLNVDALVEVTRRVTIKGADYDVADTTVDGWLKSVQTSKDLKDNNDPTAYVAALKEAIAERLPDCPVAVIGALSFAQLTAINTFINAPVAANKDAVAEGEGDAAGKTEAAPQS